MERLGACLLRQNNLWVFVLCLLPLCLFYSIIEATKLALADRDKLHDPDFDDAVGAKVKQMLDKDEAQRLRAGIDRTVPDMSSSFTGQDRSTEETVRGRSIQQTDTFSFIDRAGNSTFGKWYSNLFFERAACLSFRCPLTFFLQKESGTQVTAIDSDGNTVSIAATLGSVFGSTVFSTSVGVLLNDDLLHVREKGKDLVGEFL